MSKIGEKYEGYNNYPTELQQKITGDLSALRQALTEIAENGTYAEEDSHIVADNLLLDFIGDPEVFALFQKIEKWYA